MRILVSVPTYNNVSSGYSIRNTLEGLANQSNRDLELLLVYKPSPGDNTLGVLDEYKTRMNTEVAVQRDGFIEEAMNIIFGASKDYDLLLTIDDDAVPDHRWVQEYMSLFQTHSSIGIASFGGVDLRTLYFKRARRLLGYHVPLLPMFKDYRDYINDMGLQIWGQSREPGLVFSTALTGSSMGVRPSLLGDFKLPCTTLRGLGWECILAFHIIKQGCHSARTESTNVLHLERDSLSRPKNPCGVYGAAIELEILPYSINRQQPINIRKLRRYVAFVNLYNQLRHTTLSQAFIDGFRIAKNAVEEEWEPARVRRMIEESNRVFTANHHPSNSF